MKIKKYQRPVGPLTEPKDNTNVVVWLPPEGETLQETFPNSRQVTDFDNHPVITQGYRVVGSKGNDHRVGQNSVFGERKYVAPWNQSIAQRAWNSFTDATHLTSPPTYQDGYGRTLNAENPFWDGAKGKELKRIGKTALDTGTIIGLGFLPQSFVVAPGATVGALGLGLGADFLAGKAMDGIEKNVLNRFGLKFSDNQKLAVRLAAGLYGGSKGHKLGNKLSNKLPELNAVIQDFTQSNNFSQFIKNRIINNVLNSEIKNSSRMLQYNPNTGAFDPIIMPSEFNYKFKHLANLTDDEVKILYNDLRKSGIITPKFEFAIGKQHNPYFTFDVKHLNPENAHRAYFELPFEVSEINRKTPADVESAIKGWFDVYYRPQRELQFGFDELFPYVERFSETPLTLKKILVDQALDASRSIDYVSKSMNANNFLRKGLSNFSTPSFKFTNNGLLGSANNTKLNQIELGFSPTNTIKIFDPNTKQYSRFSVPKTMAHETAHSNTLLNTQHGYNKRIKSESPYYGMDYIFVPKKWKKLLSPSNTNVNTHDFEFAEGYGDLWGTRKSMYDMGIGTNASFDPNTKYNYLDLFRYKMTPTGMHDRFIQQRGGWWKGWKQQLDALNEVYKNGGKLFKN